MKNYQQKEVPTVDNKPKFDPPLVTEYMTEADQLITFHPETDIFEVVNTLLSNRITGAPVLNEKKEIVGLIDDKDCLKILFDVTYHNQPIGETTVAHYMSNVMRTVSAKTNILEIAETFLSTPYKRLLVLDENDKLVGQISRRDVLRAIRDFNAER